MGGKTYVGVVVAGTFNEQPDALSSATVTLNPCFELSPYRGYYPVPVPGEAEIMTGEMTLEAAWAPYGLPGAHRVTIKWASFEMLRGMSAAAQAKLLGRLAKHGLLEATA